MAKFGWLKKSIGDRIIIRDMKKKTGKDSGIFTIAHCRYCHERKTHKQIATCFGRSGSKTVVASRKWICDECLGEYKEEVAK